MSLSKSLPKSLLPVGLELKCFQDAFKAIQGGVGGGIIKNTALQKNERLSKIHHCNVFLKGKTYRPYGALKYVGHIIKLLILQ